MSKVLHYLPELEGDEQVHVATLLKSMTDTQAEQFARIYRSQRKDETTVLLLAVVGLLGAAGLQRFYLEELGMGLLYLFTGGLCVVGTLFDLFRYKTLTYHYNRDRADDIATMVQGVYPEDADDSDADPDETSGEA